jgi:hypothetical protein
MLPNGIASDNGQDECIQLSLHTSVYRQDDLCETTLLEEADYQAEESPEHLEKENLRNRSGVDSDYKHLCNSCIYLCQFLYERHRTSSSQGFHKCSNACRETNLLSYRLPPQCLL